MLLEIVTGILAIIGVLALVAAAAAVIACYLLARRLSAKMQRTVLEMELMLANSSREAEAARGKYASAQASVPPMRIRVEPIEANPWSEEITVEPIGRWLLAHSFHQVGDFRIDEPVNEVLRVFVSDDRELLAALRHQPDGTEPYVEFCFDLGDGLRGGVSNPPGSPVPLPPTAVGKYFHGNLSQDFELLSRMWLEAKELVTQQAVQLVNPQRIAIFFEEAHAAEMDSRIACGGLAEEEIRASLFAQGTHASDQDVEDIQGQWQQAIEQHLLDFSTRGRVQRTAGREILVVHDGSLHHYLRSRICPLLRCSGELDQRQFLAMVNELGLLLETFTPREAMARFRPLLPGTLRYDLIDQLHQPVEADLYTLPST